MQPETWTMKTSADLPAVKIATPESTALWVALNLAYRSVHRTMEKALKEAGLPPLRWYDVLWELERSDNGMRPFELENGLLFEQSNLSRMLRRIIDEGLVKEFAYEADGRGKMLRITAKGKRLRARMWKIYGPQIERNFAEIAKSTDAGTLVLMLKTLNT